MSDDISPSAVITRLRRSRNQLLLSQKAVLDLAKLSDTEAARLDFPESRAKRLSEAIGHSNLPLDTSMKLFSAAENLFEMRHLRMTREKAAIRKAATKQESDSKENRSEAVPNDSLTETAEGEGESAERLAFEALTTAIETAELPLRAVILVIMTCDKILGEKPRSGLMLESLLISAVAQFEVFVARMITASLEFDPSPLKASGAKYTYQEITALGSLRVFQKSVIDSFVDSLMHDGMDKWMEFLGRASRSDTAWVSDLLAEVVMRRNVHVHAGGRASAQYISSLGKTGAAVKLNDELPVTSAYLADALDRMARASIVLTQAATFAVCSSKIGKGEPLLDPDIGLVEASFDLLAAGRWSAVAPLAEQLDKIVGQASTRERLRANSFHAKKMWEGLESVQIEIEAWDLSAADDELRLVKMCLLEKVGGAKRLYDKLTAVGTLSVMELATWPILEPLRVALQSDGPAEVK